MRRFGQLVAAFGLSILAAGCGGGGGGGGTDDAGPLAWGIPFVPTGSTTTMVVGLRNLDDSATTVFVTGYKPDGTAYSAPVAVGLDGLDEARLGVSTALGGVAPEGGWISVSTPSGLVEVYEWLTVPGKQAEESSRAFPAPTPVPSPYLVGLTVTTETDLIQISNATGLAIVVGVTAYREPAGDPLLPPVASTPLPVALAPFETKLFTPDGLSGIAGFVGSFQFSSTGGFLAAAQEDLGLDCGRPQVLLEARIVEASLDFGREQFGFGFDQFQDFVLVVRNDRDTAQTVTITGIHDQDGGPILLSPATLGLAPFESRVVTTVDAPFDALFGDASLSTSLRRIGIEMNVPRGVDATFRQFDPVALEFNMTVRPATLGHMFVVMDIVPSPTSLSDVLTRVSLMNPSTSPITVRVEALIPEPDGHDGTPVLLAPVDVPAHGRVDVSPDGIAFFDRDNEPVPVIALRLFSPVSFHTTGRREHRTAPDGPIIMLSPTIVRNLEEAND